MAQLGLDAWRDLDDEIIAHAGEGVDLLHAAVLLHCGQSRLSPLLRKVRDEPVCRHINGVHRLAPPVVAGERVGQEGVGALQVAVEMGQKPFCECRLRSGHDQTTCS